MKKVGFGLVLSLCILTSTPAQAQSQNQFTFNVAQRIGSIDPAFMTDFGQYMVATNMYDNLVRISSSDELEPHVATKWSVTPNGRTYTFDLRPGITFHSGGTLTAEDVVYSMKRVLALNQGPAFLWKDIVNPENITASGPNQVKITLNRAFSPFLNSMPLLFVVNSKAIKANQKSGPYGSNGDYGQDWLKSHDEGSGPYALNKYSDGEELSMNRVQGHFAGFQNGAFDKVKVLIAVKEDRLLSLARLKGLNMTSLLQSPGFYASLKQLDGWKVSAQPTRTMLYLKMNTQRAPFDDVNVRKAVAYALDQGKIRQIFPSGTPQGVLPQSFAVHNKAIPVINQDMARAKELMAQSKYAGKAPPVELSYITEAPFEKDIALVVQKNLADIGIPATLRSIPWAKYMELATRADTTPHLSHILFGPTYPSANSVFYTQYHSASPRGWATSTWLKDNRVDKLIDEAIGTTDRNAIRSKYIQLQQRLFELMPDIPLGVMEAQYAMRAETKGFKTNPVPGFEMNIRNLYR